MATFQSTRSDARSEYLPNESEQASSTAPKLRDKCCTYKKLTIGAKLLFCRLTDLSFLWEYRPKRGVEGVVEISAIRLSQDLKVSERSIERWQRELVAEHFLWTRVVVRAGLAITHWYIRDMANPQTEFWDDDPRYKRAEQKRRKPTQDPATGKFSHGQIVANGEAHADTTNSQGTTVKMSLDPGQFDGGSRTKSPKGHGQIDGSPTDKLSGVKGHNVGSNGDSLSVVTGQSDGSNGSGSPHIKETPALKEGESASKRLAKRALQLATENEFLSVCHEVFGKAMREGGPKGEGHGGYMRTLFRQDAALARSCLAETSSMKLEGRIKQTAIACFIDLWKNNRLGTPKGASK